MRDFLALYSNAGQYDNPMRDRYQRDRYYNSLNGGIFEPSLSASIAQQGFVPYYPGNKKFAVCISHDIDHLFVQRTWKRKVWTAADSLFRGKLKKAYSDVQCFVKDRIYEPFDLAKVIEINDAFNLKSSYYFLSLQPGEEDFNYKLRDIAGQLSLVRENSCEIGLHGGHRAYNDPSKLSAERLRLEKTLGFPVQGYRNHYLRFQLPLTWKILAEAGFLYDTTFGYADCAGFRNGMCYPFYPYDVNTGTFIDILELPLIVMDATLFYYMRFDEASSLKFCRSLVEKVAACGGVFTLLWHNHFMTEEMGDTYKRILQLLSEFDPWFATSAEVVDWWKKENLIQRSHAIVQNLINH